MPVSSTLWFCCQEGPALLQAGLSCPMSPVPRASHMLGNPKAGGGALEVGLKLISGEPCDLWPVVPHTCLPCPTLQTKAPCARAAEWISSKGKVRPPREHPSWQVAQYRAALAQFPVEEPQACVRKKTPPCSHLQWGDRRLPALLPKSLPDSLATPAIPQCLIAQKVH